MRTTRLLVPVLLTLALLPSTNRVEGQGIGGLVKKKAAEAVKGKDSKNDKAKTDAKDDGPTTSTFPCTVTPDVVSRFLDGLKLENARRANFESMFAGLKSHEQVVACRQQEVMGAQVQKILSQGIGPNSTNAQLEKAMAKNSADVEAHLNKKCGEDPSKFDPMRAKEDARRAGAKEAGLSDACYDGLKEFVLSFCKLPPEQQQAAAENGIMVPGQNKWVFTPDQAKAIKPRCSELVPEIQATGYKLG